MFVSKTHLPVLLQRDQYTSSDVFRDEMEHIFHPGWHCVAATGDFPKEGDYITLQAFGYPLIIWRSEGEYHTFLNVCPHRYSMIRSKPRGHCEANLRCQYHGWTFDKTGNTRKIPDAKSFRPLEQGVLGLRKFRTETAGQLIWISLNDEAPSLAEFLGPVYAMCENWFSRNRRLIFSDAMVHPANWKVVAENTLEAYHLEEVHPKSFGKYVPEEEQVQHDFHDDWSVFQYDYSNRPEKRERIVNWLAGRKATFLYQHLMRYPNSVFTEMSLFTWVITYLPESPGKVCEVARVFCDAGDRQGLRSKVLKKILGVWGRGLLRQVRSEDASIYPGVQGGLSAPACPNNSGLISAREERVFHFQKWILDKLPANSPEGDCSDNHREAPQQVPKG